MPLRHLLAIDQGTTSTRALVYNEIGEIVGSASQEFTQHFPRVGWVEHDAEEICSTVADTVPRALASAGIGPADLAAIGLTNQRETVVLWDRASGKPVGPAIVWQDRRTAEYCRQYRNEEPWISERTGLVLDPYFSATKLRWLLQQDPALAARAKIGQLAAGTIDSWLIWKLTGGDVHATDLSNASRTLLLDIAKGAWDDELTQFFGIPPALLPQVRRSADDFGTTRGLDFLTDGIPIAGVAGDQQAALFGQGGFAAGAAKCTYGTGAFFLEHTGEKRVPSKYRLLTSLAACTTGPLHYVLEGSVFVAGAAVQWLRDGLHLIPEAPAVEELARRSDPEQPIFFVPGFVGLGAPHWVPEARGVLFGLTRNTTAAELARAALEGVAFQVCDLIEAAANDTGQRLTELRVDGGMARNAWFLERQADLLGVPLLQALDSEATARGAAFLAGLQVGLWPDHNRLRRMLPEARTIPPKLAEAQRRQRLESWKKAVEAVIAFYHA